MKIGIAFDLRPDITPANAPDDWAEEFDSPATIAAIADAMRAAGHTPVELGNCRRLIEALLADPPDLVFNIAEGTGASRSREARVPAVCETLGVPYTGSDPLTLSVALDKSVARRLVAEAGVTVPEGFVLPAPPTPYDGDHAEFLPLLAESGLTLPVIVKPVWEGSSKGIRDRCLIERTADFGPAVVGLWTDYGQPVLVEEFIAGDEVTVGVLGNDPPQILGMMRIRPKTENPTFVYSLEVKRDYERQVEYECPAALSRDVSAALTDAALTVWDALGCRDLARLDFRVRDGVPYFLEINPLPGLDPVTGDLVILAAGMGVAYPDLIRAIVDAALSR